MSQIWTMKTGSSLGPVIAVALHDGHRVRPELIPLLAVDETVRLREEDPYTGEWTDIGDIQIVGTHSRFEVDLNRSREEAVYLEPRDAWGLEVWNRPLPPKEHEASLARYDRFYAELYALLKKVEETFGSFVVYDLHAYNHRRDGAASPCAPEGLNPEINIGTGTMNRQRWAHTVDTLISSLRAFDFDGRSLDVRENVKFQGRGFPRFVHEHFPLSGCAIAIEVKKFWMDEWSGECNRGLHQLVRQALASTVPQLRDAVTHVAD